MDYESESRAELQNIFTESDDEKDEFLGFSDSEINIINSKPFSGDPVELEICSQDSNAKTSGYGSSGRELDSDSDILSDSDYEEASSQRETAMKERRSLLKNLMSDLRSDAVFKKMSTTSPSTFKTPQSSRRSFRRNPVYVSRSLPPVTRRRSKLGDPNYKEDDSVRPKLVVRFGPKRKTADSDCPSPKKKRYFSRSHLTQEHVIIDVKDVTDDMLLNIAAHSVGKKYDAVNGTSCHQCRQKTVDTKSCCRNKECVGVRGQFCGPCLKNRYGESVRDALLDPDWSCPVCKGFCNCSICRNRAGKAATGILIGLARFHGFSNVKDYLSDLKSENSFIEEDN